MKRQKRELIAFQIVMSVILVIALITAMLFYSNSLKNELYEDSVSKLTEISEQNVEVLRTKIQAQADAMKEVAARIAVQTDWDISYTTYTLNKVMQRFPFKDMGIVFPDGSAYITGGAQLQISGENFKFMQPAFNGENIISNRVTDLDGDQIITLMVPIYKGENVIAVLMASSKVDSLQDMLNVSFFNGQGYSYVVRSDGRVISESSFPTSFKNVTNIFDALKEADKGNTKACETMQHNMQFREEGYIRYRNNADYYMSYSEIGINDWYLLSVIPVSVIDSTRSGIMASTYFLCMVIFTVFILIIIYFTSQERSKRRELQDILYVDPITKGYSYQRFCKETREKLDEDKRNAAVVVLDIEKFKVINELFGYEDGDRVLCYIWSLIQDWIKPGEIYSRWVADRFSMLIFYSDENELNERLNKLSDIIQNDKLEKRKGFVIRPTIGVYRVINRDIDVESMQNYASIARSKIKGNASGAGVAFYDESYKETILENKALEDRMISALKNEEFTVFYQPKYDSVTKELAGAEALIRWKNKDGSFTPPYKFIPIAEKNGFVLKLDKYVFKKVCADQKKWLEEGKKIVPVSVNLSRQHLYNPSFIEDYRKMIESRELPINFVELEVTESAMFENQDEFMSIIDRLHKIGFKILMDDFGTGYSSMMMLKSIPIDVMKLDKSFVDDFKDEKGEKIIFYVTQLAKSMNIEVTAEGVETEEQYEFMKRMGCDKIQGFYFAKPMPREDFDKLLQQ